MADVAEVADVTDWEESADSPSTPTIETPSTPSSETPPKEPAAAESAAEPDEDDEPSQAAERERDQRGRFRHRAKKDAAGPEDVPRIRELTKRLRTVEQELATERAAKSKPKTEPSQPAYDVPTVPASEFTEPEPQLNDFADKEDPYGAWQRALARWDRRRDEHEAMRTHQRAHVEHISRQQAEYWRGVSDSHNRRLLEAIQKDPNVGRVLHEARDRFTDRATGRSLMPPTLESAILLDTDGAAMAVFLASHPAVLDELVLMTAAKPVTQQTVETTQRLLRQRMTAVSSGAVAPSPQVSPAPRPPTPLRTAPMKSGETMPGDDDSVEAHERFFKHSTGRRR